MCDGYEPAEFLAVPLVDDEPVRQHRGEAKPGQRHGHAGRNGQHACNSSPRYIERQGQQDEDQGTCTGRNPRRTEKRQARIAFEEPLGLMGMFMPAVVLVAVFMATCMVMMVVIIMSAIVHPACHGQPQAP